MAEIYTTTYKSKTVFMLFDDAGKIVLPNNIVRKSVTGNSFGVGMSWQKRDFSKFDLVETHLDIEYLVTSDSEKNALVSFFSSTAIGRLNVFWVPSWINNYTPITDAGGTGIYVNDGYHSEIMDYPNTGIKYRHLVTFQDDYTSTPQFSELTDAYTYPNDGFEVLTVTPWTHYRIDGIIMNLFYCRLGSDSLRVSFAGPNRYRINFSCKELQRETPT